jgi:hypothetical protein
VTSDFLRGLNEFVARMTEGLPHLEARARLVYGGDRRATRTGVEVIPWSEVQSVRWAWHQTYRGTSQRWQSTEERALD